MSDFIIFLIRPLLTKPDELQVTPSDHQVMIKVASEDMGRVIGKAGVIISALRNLARVYCYTHNLPPVNLTLQE